MALSINNWQGIFSFMNRLLLIIFAIIISSTASAQLNGDGYYRVQNQYSNRYIVVNSNKAKANMSTNEVDLGALETYKSFDKIVSNPGSIIYIENHGDNQYVLRAQGTNTLDMTGYYLKIRDNKNGTYKAYATVSGVTKYLSDEPTTLSEGILMTSGTKARDWYIKPVDSNGDNYFGLTPDLSIGSDNYATIYASFPFSFSSKGMNAYYICKVDVERNVAVYKEITDVVPASTPVFVKCASSKATENRLNLINKKTNPINDNILAGVYFKNSNSTYYNQVAYDAATMRVLGKMSDGTLGFVKVNIDFLPANKAYLKVPVSASSEIRLMSVDEYATGIDDVFADSVVDMKGIFTLTGLKVDADIDALPSGVYIVNGKKVVVK